MALNHPEINPFPCKNPNVIERLDLWQSNKYIKDLSRKLKIGGISFDLFDIAFG